MLVFACIIPPTPFLLPHIGKEHAPALAKTSAGIQALKSSLAAHHADVCLLISQHGVLKTRFGIGINDIYRGSLQSFGDLREYTFSGAPVAGQHLLMPLPHGMAGAVTQHHLDHGSVVACRLLFPEQSIPLLPLHPSLLSYESHVRFGAAIAEPLRLSQARAALIMVGDLSHHATKDSPEGYRPEGVLFDQAVRASFEKNSAQHLINTAHKYEEESSLSGIRAFLVALGLMTDYRVRFNLLASEAPFGIGYLTAECIL